MKNRAAKFYLIKKNFLIFWIFKALQRKGKVIRPNPNKDKESRNMGWAYNSTRKWYIPSISQVVTSTVQSKHYSYEPLDSLTLNHDQV